MAVMMSGDGAGWPAWGTALMWIAMTAVLAFLIGVAYALITSASRGPDRDKHTPDARSVLDQRLARGEINAAEYQHLRSLIASGDS